MKLSSVADRIRKRRFYPFTIAGETVHLRGLTNSEHAEIEPFAMQDESTGFAIGCCLLNDDGSPVFTRSPDEPATQFGGRVLKELDLPDDTKSELTNKIISLAKGPPKLEEVIKN
jgi:hypothetical protein